MRRKLNLKRVSLPIMRRKLNFGSSSVERAHNLWNGVLLGVVEAEEPLTTCVCGGLLPREWCSLVSLGRGVCGVIARGERGE